METVYEALIKVGWVKSKQEKKQEIEKEEEHYCLYHEKSLGHSIQSCQEFLDLVQKMMNEGRIEFCGKMEEQAINVLQDEVPKSLTILYRGGGQKVTGGSLHFSTPN